MLNKRNSINQPKKDTLSIVYLLATSVILLYKWIATSPLSTFPSTYD